jgi:hypothetical protein
VDIFAVVIPAYNEKEALTAFHRALAGTKYLHAERCARLGVAFFLGPQQ